jgi:hypothetical protein
VRSKKGKQGIGVERFRVVAKPVPLPEPGVTSQALDVNDSGVIVGYGADASGASVALRWTAADTGWTYTVLGAGSAVAINNSGLILRRNYDWVTRVWHSWVHLASGAVVDLGAVYVTDISDNGMIIGSVTDSLWNPIAVVWRQMSAVTWGPPQQLPIPQGYSGARLASINAAGDIAGTAYTDSTEAPVVWRNNEGQWHTSELVETELIAGAIAINDGGAIAGWIWPCIQGLSNCYPSPALWSSPAPRARSCRPSTTTGGAFGMNNANQIVGSAFVHYDDGTCPLAATVYHAVIWFPGAICRRILGPYIRGQAGKDWPSTAMAWSWDSSAIGMGSVLRARNDLAAARRPFSATGAARPRQPNAYREITRSFSPALAPHFPVWSYRLRRRRADRYAFSAPRTPAAPIASAQGRRMFRR